MPGWCLVMLKSSRRDGMLSSWRSLTRGVNHLLARLPPRCDGPVPPPMSTLPARPATSRLDDGQVVAHVVESTRPLFGGHHDVLDASPEAAG
jgi:hypothetical protein